MSRKWVLLVCGILILAGILTACAGPQGERGPVGPAGPAGPEGPPGASAEPSSTSVAEPVAAEFVGHQVCSGCHDTLSQSYMKSGHPWSLSSASQGKTPDYPYTEISALPRGYTLDDISYIIGGYNWKAIFVDSNGYIITNPPEVTENTAYLNQLNLGNTSLGLSSNWSSFHAGEAEFSFICGECHATGYDNGGSQDNLVGITGTWAQPGVQCEECHGPGSLHATNPEAVQMNVESESALCEECHTYKDVHPASLEIENGFIQHQDQYGDLSQSKHQILECLTCHDPHTGVVQLRLEGLQSTRLLCQDCHFKQAQNQKVAAHVDRDINCVDCHMPRLIQNASANPLGRTGDFRTHVVAIDSQSLNQFTADGGLASGQISLDYACRHCHGMNKTDEQLFTAANGYHAPLTGQLNP